MAFKRSLIDLIPSGSIINYAGSSDPSGWFICDGRAVSKDEYGDLWKAIGTSFGEDDSSSFKIPDLRNYFVRGLNGDRNIGDVQSDEFKSHSHLIDNVNARTDDSGAHTHSMDTSGYHNHGFENVINYEGEGSAKEMADAINNESGTGFRAGTRRITDGTIQGVEGDHDNTHVVYIEDYTNGTGTHSHNIEDSEQHNHAFTINNASTNDFGSSETRPINIALNFIIKF